MTLTWLDWLSFAADVVTFIGIPVLAFSTWRFYEEVRQEIAERKKERFVSEGCLEFSDPQQDVGINLVPLENITVLPRPGDFVILPGETHNGKNEGRGQYVVEQMSFLFFAAKDVIQPCPAVLSKITAHVKKREGSWAIQQS